MSALLDTLVRVRCVAALALSGAEDGVERPSPGAAPTAFRIWKAGDNVTDYGVHRFTEESAKLLMEEQATRQNLYSIDIDHLSTDEEARPEQRGAYGWHRLDVRASADGPELWAVDVEWDADIKAGLEAKPPRWRYFSPTYSVGKKTGVIKSYLNTALTNNPATHGVTTLASRGRRAMESIMADYAAIAAALFGGDDEKKKDARAAIAAMSDDERKECSEYMTKAMAGEGEEKPKDGEGERKEKPKDGGDGETKEGASASRPSAGAARPRTAGATAGVNAIRSTQTDAEALTQLGDQDRRIAALEESHQRHERERIMATRPDLTKSQRGFLDKKPVEELEALLELIPKPAPDPAASSRVNATRGASQTSSGEGAVRASRLSPTEHSDVAARFGRVLVKPKIHWEGTSLVLPLISRADAEALIEARAKEGPLPRGVELEEVRASIMPKFRALRGTPQAA